MIQSIFTALLVIAIPALSNLSAEQKAPPPSQMPMFMESVRKLQAFMVSDEAFANPANEKIIQGELAQLEKIANGLTHNDFISQPVLRDSAKRLQNHLSDLVDTFQASKTYSRYLLNSTLTACSSCHSQLPQTGKPVFRFDPQTLVGSDFQKAEFLFSIRQFPEALKLYEKSMKNPDRQIQKMKALDRGLVIHLVHERNPKKAEAWVKSFPIRHDDEKPTIENYLKQVRGLNEIVLPDLSKASSNEIAAFAEKMLKTPDNFANRLLTSGILHSYLQKERAQNRKPSAAIYYWIGVCDRPLQSSFVFSLIRDDFETCIELAPKSDQARKCFEELEEDVLASYSGTDGMDLPADEARSLNEWRVKAGLKKKAYLPVKN